MLNDDFFRMVSKFAFFFDRSIESHLYIRIGNEVEYKCWRNFIRCHHQLYYFIQYQFLCKIS